MRSFTRLGSCLSVAKGVNVGENISVYKWTQLGSTVSIRRHMMAGSCSLMHCAVLGSCVSVRNVARMGSHISVLSCGAFGSSISLRSFTRAGSGLSVAEKVRATAFSVFGTMALGSCVSVRSFARMGSHASVFYLLSLGSALSVRSFVRCGSSLSVQNVVVGNTMYLGNAHNKIVYSGSGTTAYKFHAQTSNAASASSDRITISVDGTNNIFHGSWHFQNTPTIGSDRRLKNNITPLYDTLQKVAQARRPSAKNDTIGADGVADLFRSLNPVSYHMKKDIESKNLYFGFIAQELEELYPSMVYTDTDGMKSVQYNDIIALVTLTIQQEMQRLDLVDVRLTHVEDIADKHDDILSKSEVKIRQLEEELRMLQRGEYDDMMSAIADKMGGGMQQEMVPLLASESQHKIQDRSKQDRSKGDGGN